MDTFESVNVFKKNLNKQDKIWHICSVENITVIFNK